MQLARAVTVSVILQHGWVAMDRTNSHRTKPHVRAELMSLCQSTLMCCMGSARSTQRSDFTASQSPGRDEQDSLNLDSAP